MNISGPDIQLLPSLSQRLRPNPLNTGREIWLREGPIDDAVRASISLPGLLSRLSNGDRWLVDGGLVNPVPVSVCRALGADVVIAVNLNGDLVARHALGYYQRDAGSAAGAPPEFVTRIVNQFPTASAGAGVVDPPEARIRRADISRLFPRC